MNDVIKRANRAALKILNRLNGNRGARTPFTFWFYSESESNIYRLAAHFQFNGYHVSTYQPELESDQFLCIAEKEMKSDQIELDRLCVDMEIVAERFGVIFDGWESRIDTAG